MFAKPFYCLHHQQSTEQQEFERKRAQVQLKDEAKTDKNRAKREKKKLAALKAQAVAKGNDPSKVSLNDTNANSHGEPEAKKQRLHNDAVQRIEFQQRHDSDNDASADDS